MWTRPEKIRSRPNLTFSSGGVQDLTSALSDILRKSVLKIRKRLQRRRCGRLSSHLALQPGSWQLAAASLAARCAASRPAQMRFVLASVVVAWKFHHRSQEVASQPSVLLPLQLAGKLTLAVRLLV